MISPEIRITNVKIDTTLKISVCHTIPAFWVTPFTVIVMFNENKAFGFSANLSVSVCLVQCSKGKALSSLHTRLYLFTQSL